MEYEPSIDCLRAREERTDATRPQRLPALWGWLWHLPLGGSTRGNWGDARGGSSCLPGPPLHEGVDKLSTLAPARTSRISSYQVEWNADACSLGRSICLSGCRA